MLDSTFESVLSGQLRAYAEAGVRPIDRYAIAEETIAGGRPRGFGERLRGRSWVGGLSLILVGLLVMALAATVALVGSRLLTPPPPVQLPHSYTDELVSVPDLPVPMAHPELVPLVDGRVLVIGAGGAGGDPTTTAVVYDPATGVSVNAGPLVSPERFVSSAVRLNDGRVLIVGDAIAQLFDPTTLRFAAVGPMITARSRPRMVMLRDGRVLIAGGSIPGQDAALRSAELFDPVTLTFSTTGSMSAAGAGAMATLPDGRVFVASNPTAEVYDPRTGTFRAAGATPSFGVTASITMPDGRVAVVGLSGLQSAGHAAVWDPTSQTFSAIFDGPEPIFAATMLDDGRILMTGGRYESWSGIYDPTTGATTEITPPTAWRPSSTRLADGRVLIVGGLIDGNVRPGPSGGGSMAPAVPTVEIFR